MPRLNLNQNTDWEDSDFQVRFTRQKSRSAHALLDEAARASSLENLGAADAFRPTLGASRHEREWIFNFLGPYYDDQTIVDVLKRVKGGKEANVYICRAHPSTGRELLAAKLYRPRMFRNLRNDARYRTGRALMDEQGKETWNHDVLHAVRKGTSMGKEIAHASWLAHEYRTLEICHAAGVPVPEPVAMGNNIILMEYIGDMDLPAPSLVETTLPRKSVRRCLDTILEAISRMLAAGRIHADLSAYNVLYWQDRPILIDFPQAINPDENPEAWLIFARDVMRVCGHFQRYYGLRLDGPGLAADLWRSQRGEPNPPFLPPEWVAEEEVE